MKLLGKHSKLYGLKFLTYKLFHEIKETTKIELILEYLQECNFRAFCEMVHYDSDEQEWDYGGMDEDTEAGDNP